MESQYFDDQKIRYAVVAGQHRNVIGGECRKENSTHLHDFRKAL
jgi:hypothetical protein